MKNLIFQKIKEEGLVTSNQQKIVSPDGGTNNWIFDLRAVFMDAEVLDQIAECFWEQFEDKLPFQVGGLEVGAIPLISAILMKAAQKGLKINGFIIRKERKNIGLCKNIEGNLTDEKIIIVDDLINSGTSLQKIQTILQSEKRKIDEAFFVIDFENQVGRNFCKKEKIKCHSLFTLADFDLNLKIPQPPKESGFEYQWHFQSPNPNYFFVVPKSTPVLDDKNLYFGTDSGIFCALEQKTGKVVWEFQTGDSEKGIFSSPAVHGRIVFFGGYDGNFYALDTRTGKEKWKFAEANWIGSSPAISPDLDLIFVGLEHAVHGKKGSIVALDLETGNKKWEWVVSELLHGSPAYLPSKKLVAIGTNDSTVLLFNAENGRLLWTFQTDGPVKASLVFDEKRSLVIFGSHDGNCYGVDLDSGSEIFRIETDNVIYSTPLIFNDKLYFGSTDKNFYIVDLDSLPQLTAELTNGLLKKTKTNGKILSSPREINGKIYFGANDGQVRELDPESLKITDYCFFPDRITNAITYSEKNGLFYTMTCDNQIFAFSKKQE